MVKCSLVDSQIHGYNTGMKFLHIESVIKGNEPILEKLREGDT